MKKAITSSQQLLTPIIFFLLSYLVSSQTDDSCNSNLNINAQFPFDTSFHCVSVWPPHNFVLRYAQSSADTWSFVLSAPDRNAYVAVGFSSNGMMVGSSAVVGWVSDGTPMVKQYFLGAQNPTQVVPDQGNLVLNTNSTMVVSQSSRLYLAFQLVSNAQPSSRLLYAVGPTGLLPSPTRYTLSQHDDKASTNLNYVTGQISKVSLYTRLRKSHGILNMIGWGILLIIGAIVARHMKEWDPVWFYAHVSIQSLGFALGLTGVICGLALENHLNVDVSTHKATGITILVLGCLQVVAFLARPEKTSKVRKYWNWYHIGLGRCLMAFAIGNVFYGIHLGGEGHGWNAGYGVVIAILFLIAVVLEVRLWKRM